MSSNSPQSPAAGTNADSPCDEPGSPCNSEKRCPFDIDIDLVKHSDGYILTPLKVRDAAELISGGTNNQPFAAFEIEIEKNPVDFLEVEITTSAGRVWYQELKDTLLDVGVHHWNWGGYNDARLLDTKVLKDPSLKLELRGTRCGVQKTKVIKFSNKAAECDFVDIQVDGNAKTVTVELRVNLKQGSADGVGEAPPTEIFSTPPNNAIPANDPSRQVHIRRRSPSDLLALALTGLHKYWSRDASNGLSVTTDEGAVKVTTNAVNATDKAMDDVDLSYNTNRDWGRSSNPGTVTGFLSLFGNFVPERVIYNVGWIKYSSGWQYRPDTDEDPEFSLTAAHEIGHEILNQYGGDGYSYGHRGSSNPVTQSPNANATAYPAAGEIDLMKYYNGYQPADVYARTVACETDVYSLIWLARVKFND
jgi:hypothetical protein